MNIFRSLFGKDHQIDESSLLASLEARIRKERELDVGQIVRNENRLSLFDGSLLVKVDGIYLESDAESGIQHLHTHVISSFIGNFQIPFDACLNALGPSAKSLMTDISEMWVQMVAAPIVSMMKARPVLQADHFEGPELWGIPGSHGFVGPFFARGESGSIDFEVLNDLGLFRKVPELFSRESLNAQPMHLCKAVLSNLGQGWSLCLELDGHAESITLPISDPRLPAQSSAIITRYAVFFLDQLLEQLKNS